MWGQRQTCIFCTDSGKSHRKISAKTTHSEDVNRANLLCILPLLKREYVWHLLRMDAWHCCQSKSINFLYIRSLFYFKSYMHIGWQQADFPNCSALSLLASGIRPSRYSVFEMCSASSRVVPPTISPFRRSVMLLQSVVYYNFFSFFFFSLNNNSVAVERNKASLSPNTVLYWETIENNLYRTWGLSLPHEFLNSCEYPLPQGSY